MSFLNGPSCVQTPLICCLVERFRPYGGSLLADAPKVSKKSCPLHPGLAALDFPRSIIASGAGVQGPSLALYASRRIHAARSLPQRFHSAF
ncbi:hypothetical protein PSEUDO9AZ_20843 [Pseudomonas sp. 9AZ]|nr:hypothetical protein PSEUDO9AZ_20843 [Pseudomonas sp. 9AZ]